MKFRNILFFPATFFCANKQRLTEQRATVKDGKNNFFKKMQLHKLVQLEQADGTSLELFKSIFSPFSSHWSTHRIMAVQKKLFDIIFQLFRLVKII